MKKLIIFSLMYAAIFCYGQTDKHPHRIVAVGANKIYIMGERIYCFHLAQGHKTVLPDIPYAESNHDDLYFSQDPIALDDSDNLWILLTNHLLFYDYHSNNWHLLSLAAEICDSQYYGSPASIEFWQDNIWIATNDNLWCYHIDRGWWEQFPYPAGYNGGIIKKDKKNRLWLDGQGYFDGKDWHILPRCPIPLSFWPKTSQCFTWDSKGNPWLATVQGVYFFDGDYRCWRQVAEKKFTRAYSICYFKDKIWCADYSKGLFCYDGNKWQKIESGKPRPRLTYVYALYPTAECLWFNTYFGVGSFTKKIWRSHYDYTNYYKLQKNSLITMVCVVILLLAGIVGFLLLGRIKRNYMYASRLRRISFHNSI